jgi:hypothetical protein
LVSFVHAGHDDVATLDETEFFAGIVAGYPVPAKTMSLPTSWSL